MPLRKAFCHVSLILLVHLVVVRSEVSTTPPPGSQGPSAICLLRGLRGHDVSGSISFQVDATGGVTTVSAQVSGLALDSDHGYGIYLHQFGDVRAADGSSMGAPTRLGEGPSSGCPFWNISAASGWTVGPEPNSLVGILSLGAVALNGSDSIVGRAIAIRYGISCETPIDSVAGCVVGIANTVDAKSNTAAGPAATRAVCVLEQRSGARITGTMYFEESAGGKVKVTGLFDGVWPGQQHGVHIHQFGDSRVPGLHFDPTGVMRHALPLVDMRHAGDLGNLVGLENGTACYSFDNEIVKLSGVYNVIGRALLVTADADDGCAQPVGRSGDGVASCVVGVANDAVPFPPPFDCPTKQQRGHCEMPTQTLRVPPGFKVSTFASNVGFARKMVRSPSGVIYVGSMNLQHFGTTVLSGISNVHAVVDSDGDNVADKYYTLLRDLSVPCGVEFKDGSLYVSLLDRILRLDDIENRLDNPPEPVVVTTAFPDDLWHGWKFIKFGPDGHLYVPVGAPCNTCNCTGLFCTMSRLDVSNSSAQPEIVFTGMRNSVGFDWDPATGDLWWTDNGRDEWGNDTPPDELNRVPADAQGPLHFGFPFCYGKDISDPQYNGVDGACDERFVPAAFELGPHVAALGMRFYDGSMFPQKYRKPGRVFIAEHGSWNRDDPLGYRVTTVNIHEPESYEVFVDGWLGPRMPNQPPVDTSAPNDTPNAWGRPTDVLVMPDGSLLVSDDKASAIYRVTYEGPADDDLDQPGLKEEL